MIPRLLTPKSTYTIDYPEAIEFAKKQNSIFWTDEEIHVEKDIQDIMVNMGSAAKHGVITVLKLFTLYELIAGNEYWGGRVAKTFQRPDIQRMANCFAFFELNVHAPFYNKLNECLHINTDDFYSDYINDPVLSERIKFINTYVDNKDNLLSLGVFSMVEGAILYSSFAFLKHFQSQGKNQLLNVVRGINFSVADENIHAEGGAWLYRTLREEGLASGQYTKDYINIVETMIITAAQKLYEHEERIVDMIFEEGKIEGITDVQLKNFVQSRINLCLRNLGIKPIFEVKYNPIKDWFYKNINSIQFHDFFTGIGNSYNRTWNESSFKW
jgi:ribonucleotide reductase beta subunit family protein with ferritin-like domain